MTTETSAGIESATLQGVSARLAIGSPPRPEEYQREVAKRVARGEWHQKWVHELGFLEPGPSACVRGTLQD
jgi:hypothetical protein